MESTLGPQLGALKILGMTAGLLITYELCYRAGRLRREETRDAKKSQAEVALAALFTLLGLLLAFSFEISEARFDKRKEIVLDEGTAVETAYLRAATLPRPHDVQIQALLRRYAERRLASQTVEELERAIKDSASDTELWAATTAVARESGSPVVALFVDSVNRMLDLHEARITVALFQRLPKAIFSMLYIVALLSVGMVGLRAGLDQRRGWLIAAVLIVAIMSVIFMIDSLDSPTSRFFQVNQYAIDHARGVMTRNQTATSQ